MKIAVCLSGQPRVLEYALPSIQDFFSGNYEFDFFCHAWNYNTYKRLNTNAGVGEQPVYWTGDEPVDVKHLEQLLLKLNPKKYAIQGPEVLDNRRFGWDSLFFSLMYANYLKKSYEIENDFRYDFVVRTRYDITYFPKRRFQLTALANKDNYHDIYHLHCNRMSYEYNRINASDTVFYGSSLAMDFMSDVYRDINAKSKLRRLDDNECLGPGTSISDFGDDRNMRAVSIIGEIYEAVYRPEVAPANPMTDFDNIRKFNDTFYQMKKPND
jgi:hypothetical protein